MNKIHQGDCLEFMLQVPDKYFDLILTDPPYGIKVLRNGGSHGTGRICAPGDYSYADNSWDGWKPPKQYFNEIFRISKHQIIFGANHFIESMPRNSSCWLVWDKDNADSTFADCELAWTSFKTAVRKYKYRWNGMLQADMRNKEARIHPTQKPVRLFSAILQDYAKSGMKVFDPFMGSGTTAIATTSLSLEWCGCELDAGYVKRANERLEKVQMNLFNLA